MNTTTRALGNAVLMALAWAFVWALPGGVIEAVDNVAPAAHPFTRQIDMWPQTLGLPGLVAGVLFAVALLVTGVRRLAEVALTRAAAWGVAAGGAVGALVVWGTGTGLSEPVSLAAAVLAYAALMGAVSGPSSVLLLRYVGRRRAFASVPGA